MSSLLHPTGPEPPSVYWRRRLLVGLAILVALIIIVVMFWPGGGSETPPVVASPSASASPTASASPSASPSASTSAAVADECADSDIQVTAQIAKQTNPVGTPIQFTMLIGNTSGQECTRNVGPRVNTFIVTSGGYHAWSSDDCGPAGGDQFVSIPAQGAYQVTATWKQNLTDSGCPSGLGNAQPGSYSVVGKNGSVTSPSVTFAIS